MIIITRKIKNKTFHEIQQRGMNPNDFTWTEIVSQKIFPFEKDPNAECLVEALVHRPTNSKIEFKLLIDSKGLNELTAHLFKSMDFKIWKRWKSRLQSYGFRVDFSKSGIPPNRSIYIVSLTPAGNLSNRQEIAISLEEVEKLILEWINYMEYESEPDLWTDFGEHFFTKSSFSNIDNNSFSHEDKAKIYRQLLSIKVELKEKIEKDLKAEGRDLTSQEDNYFDEKFTTLEKGLNQWGKKDWIQMFGSTMITVANNFFINPSQIKELVQFGFNLLEQTVRLLLR